jgi:dynein heavy chain, axonemal
MKEDLILIRAMRDSNIPKFIKEDLPLFNALVGDLFPGIQIEDSRNATLME